MLFEGKSDPKLFAAVGAAAHCEQAAAKISYQRHDPEKTLLYQTVQLAFCDSY